MPFFAGVDLFGPDGGSLVVGCLLVQGATVPDSAPDGGVPLLVHGASASCPEPGSIIEVGPLGQGAVVPTVGLGGGGGLLVRGAVGPGRLVGV